MLATATGSVSSDSRYLCEGPLLSFEHNGIGRSGDNSLHDGAGGEVVLDGTESAAYTVLRGKELDLIAHLEIEAYQGGQAGACRRGSRGHLLQADRAGWRQGLPPEFAMCRSHSGCSCQ